MIAQGLDPKDPKQDNANYLALEQKLQGMTFTFNQLVPPIERLPVLRLTWPDQVKPPVSHYAAYAKDYGLALSYRGHDYVVADVDTDCVDPNQFATENETWNRDMFRLIDQLSSQVTVDISKFPLPDILQLRTE